jgi:hypothetical protein
MNLDLYDLPPAADLQRHALDARGDGSAAGAAPAARPYIGVLFECCGVYVRIYRRPAEPVYRGRCPRCLRTATARVGPGGTNERVFRAI